MSRNRAFLAEELTSRFRGLDSIRRQAEHLFHVNSLSKRTTERLYESLFLTAFTSFEGFMEDAFVGLLLSGKSGYRRNSTTQPRITVLSPTIARELVYGLGRQYADWLPFERTESRAEMFFRAGRPFTTLELAKKEILRKAHFIRNAIAHSSRSAIQKFEREVIGATPLPPRERTPAGFLRGTFIAAPPQTRYEDYVGSLLVIARDLTR